MHVPQAPSQYYQDNTVINNAIPEARSPVVRQIRKVANALHDAQRFEHEIRPSSARQTPFSRFGQTSETTVVNNFEIYM
jgi:hypothetical protein